MPKAKARKFVIISDLHAHPWTAFAEGEGGENSRLCQTIAVFRRSLAYAQRHDYPWLFGGDLVHTAGFGLNVVLSALTAAFHDYADVLKFAVWGNHDSRGVGATRITLGQTVYGALRLVPNLFIVEPGRLYEMGNGLVLSGCGAQPRMDLIALGELADVGLYHLTLHGSAAPSGFRLEEGLDPDLLLERHRFSVVGDVHHPQEMPAPTGQAILVPGAPEHHNFGDHGERGWWVASLYDKVDKDPTVEFIPSNSPKFLTVETPADVHPDGNFYRVERVTVGDVLPANAKAVSPTPTMVKARETFKGMTNVSQVVETWVLHHDKPPEEDIGDVATYIEVGRQLLKAQEPTQLRNCRIRSIALHNFCSYAAATLRVKDGVWLVTGQGRDYPSNGAGKTTLVGESLFWLLTGRTTKGMAADEVLRYGANECIVQAELDDELSGGTVIVTRRRDGAGHTLEVTHDGEPWTATSVNDMTTKLCQWLGITPEIYQNLCYFSQEKLTLFSSATDGERKGVLSALIGLDAYQQASAEAGVQFTKHAKEQEQSELRHGMLADQITMAEERHSRRVAQADAWDDDYRTRQAEATEVLTAAQQERDRAETWTTTRRRTFEHKLELYYEARATALEKRRPLMQIQARKQIDRDDTEHVNQRRGEIKQLERAMVAVGFATYQDAEEAVKQLEKVDVTVAESTQRVSLLESLYQERRVSLAKARTILSAANDHLQAVADEFSAVQQAWAEGVCPTCRQTITEEHKEQCSQDIRTRAETAATKVQEATSDVDRLQREMEEFADDRTKAQERLATAQQIQRNLHHIRDLAQQRNAIRQELIERTKVADSAVGQLVETMVARERDRLRATCRARQVWGSRTIDGVLKAAQDALNLSLLERERLSHESNPHRQVADESEADLAPLHQRLHDAEDQVKQHAADMAIYDYWRQGFSRQGIQSLLMEEVATAFNEARGTIFPLLTRGVYDVQFSTLSRTRANELRERTEFHVYEHGKPTSYNVLSGGQRRRIDIGIMLVMTLAVAKWMGTPGVLGLLVLDEVFGFLDDSGAEGLVDALQQVQLVVPTIYTITHDPHLQALVPDVIRVVQDADGLSTVATM